ncbi:hypothetical protein CKAH01_06083 [Colletotrichum kahawae]|uniref:Uncharacterized protein n=1 Tax=Colletotrichum kahawae TaxID=34407 RepID=A0AAE0D4S7_COLKA|nr:hypothetical protein CKAH01_06083 [Colletotrichum kahawae]
MKERIARGGGERAIQQPVLRIRTPYAGGANRRSFILPEATCVPPRHAALGIAQSQQRTAIVRDAESGSRRSDEAVGNATEHPSRGVLIRECLPPESHDRQTPRYHSCGPRLSPMLGIQDIAGHGHGAVVYRGRSYVLRKASAGFRFRRRWAPFSLVCFVACPSSSQKDLLLDDPDASFIAVAGPPPLLFFMCWDDWEARGWIRGAGEAVFCIWLWLLLQ